jgi:hypothetical protein
MLTGLSAVGWSAWQHTGRIAWGDVLAAVILVVLCVMANDLHKNFSELRLRLHALEQSVERVRQLAEDREAVQPRWKP